MSIADYQGRKIDILAFQGARPAGDTLLTQSFFGASPSGQVVTGIDKLVQRWVLEFLTELGSMTYLPLRGCTFMLDVHGGGLLNTADVETAFKFAMADVARNLINEEDDSMPDDERYADAELLSVAVDGSSITLYTQVNSLAGTSRKPILPINVVP